MRALGRGEPLLMLSGAGGRGSVFLPLARRWQASFRVLMPDPEPPYEPDAAAHAMIRRLENAGVGSFHLLGVSLGGCVAQVLAALWPERVLSLTLSATFARLDDPARRTIEALRDLRRTGGDEAFAAAWSAALYGEDAAPRLPARGFAAKSLCAQLDAALSYDGTALLSRIRCPARITLGVDDRLIPPALTAALAADIRGASLMRFAGGHMHWLRLAEAIP